MKKYIIILITLFILLIPTSGTSKITSTDVIDMIKIDKFVNQIKDLETAKKHLREALRILYARMA